jgi:flagellin
MMKVAEGAVSSTVDILKTLKEKVINAANDTNTDDDRATIQKELNQSIDQIDDNANVTYNGKYLVDGSKNTIGDATCTVMTNQMLNTATVGGSTFVSLLNANGESLEIEATDKVTVSYTHQGKTYTCTAKVSDFGDLDTALASVLAVGNAAGDNATAVFTGAESSIIGTAASGKTVYTADGSCAISLQSTASGIAGQISGFNIRITDNEGNVKKSANAALDGFTEQITAQNQSQDNALTFHVGAKANQSIKVGLGDMRSEALGLKGSDGTKLNISTQEKANAAVNVLDNAVQKALNQQTTIGAVESRLNYTSTNLTTASENVQASESTIRDADMAKEMTNYTKNNVLLQAAQSMLAQANQSSSSVLSLLQ